ncbi:DHA2 family efflux MFS transporter permease subunit [Gluconacetobacter diazotrophicus]|uniref:Putative drug resistance transporter n=1 Tax=Gluconacetobacter diazotrophicus (strain ATCC 49037 / DSM 5601 / CCUG 37298 / CIP 103539 / LMG 7603 / PAl5) TaxID=272568 RepID=A9H562_GLUDA|nr:DHA2 family efflux MFS transporter permease subunit [Gluconacetobacter diazotrophicus]CAP54292.1 putative drug resistance transporter [Gluconacetobacter diazotrophicus PA1 5]
MNLPPADRLAPGAWRVVCVAAIGSFMAQLDATVVNVSLAPLAVELHAGLPAIQWVMSGYLLALALTLPLNGWLVDRIGARALYLWCFAAFTLSSGLCGLAWSAPSLVAFRVLQGMAGGLLAPMAQMMVARVAGRNMAQVAGIAALPILLAPLLGPVAAGAILHFASWRWLFLVNLPVGGLALALAATVLPDDRQDTRPRGLDLTGLALLSPGLVLFLYGSDHACTRTGGAALAVSVILFALYYRAARARGDAALIDLRLFGGRNFSAAIVALFMLNGISYAGQMLVPIYLVRACGLSPGQTGWLMAPLGLGMMCTYPFMGRLTKRFGIRRLAAGGALLALAGTLPLIVLARHGFAAAVLAPGLFLRGIGISAIGIPSMTSGYAAVARRDLPMATTAMNIVQRLGGPMLTTLCATFLGWRLSATAGAATVPGAFAASFGLLCILHALLVLAALRLPRRLPGAGPAP